MRKRLKLIPMLLLFVTLFSSCGTTLYYHKQGTVNIDKQNNYEVKYVANLGGQVNAKITYTDESTKKVKLAGISGNWTKTVNLKSGQRVKFKVVTNSEVKKLSQFKVIINGKELSEKEINQDKAKYFYSFILP